MSWRSLSQAISRFEKLSEARFSECECQTDTWDLHTGCDLEPSALPKAKNSKYKQRELLDGSCGKAQARAEQAVHLRLGLWHSGFSLVLAGGQVTSTT